MSVTIVIVLCFLLTILTAMASSWLVIKLYKFETLDKTGIYYSVVEALCDAAEHFFTGPGRGVEKRDWVQSLAKEEAESLKLKYDPAVVEAVIQSYVNTVINADKSK